MNFRNVARFTLKNGAAYKVLDLDDDDYYQVLTSDGIVTHISMIYVINEYFAGNASIVWRQAQA